MHELSICRAIVGIVDRHAAGREVRAVHVRVGALRQIIPDTLVYCWSLVNSGTPLAEATLEVEQVDAEITCTQCGHAQKVERAMLVCSRCGSGNVRIVAGEEFLITTLDLAEA